MKTKYVGLSRAQFLSLDMTISRV